MYREEDPRILTETLKPSDYVEQPDRREDPQRRAYRESSLFALAV